MKGIVNVRVSNARISFELRLERNITILSGDSATGKTTLVGMIRDYEEDGRSSGVTVQSHKPCRVLTNADWQYRLASITDSIVFLDEGNSFVKSEAFARTIQGSSNYYVIITRESLYQLPYSVTAILKLKTTTKRKKTFVRAYPQYDNLQNPSGKIEASETVLTEDSNSGYELFSYIAQRSGTQCISAQGKSNVFSALNSCPDRRMLVIADGAAFGAELEKVYRLMEQRPSKITLYLPESFEWLVLKSGVLGSQTPREILGNPAAYIESSLYFSWEQYFTDLLVHLTQETVLRYNKGKLNPAYLQSANVEKILDAM